MQISKRELSRKAELKEYCGGGTVVRTSNPRWGRVCGRRQGTAAGAGDAGMQCTGENRGKLGVCLGKRMVTAGHEGPSAAGEPRRGRTTQEWAEVPGQQETYTDFPALV